MKKAEILDKNTQLGMINNRYSLVKELGSGGTSIIYKAIDLQTQKEFAIKVFHDYHSPFLENEVKINKMISQSKSPFFIEYFGSSVGYFSFGEKKEFKTFMVLEYADKGEAISYFTHHGIGLNEKHTKICFSKILKRVKALHRMGICHLDLKLDNILLCGENYTIKIADFGFSSFIEKNKKGKAKKQNKNVGTKNYTAPEIVLGKKYDGERADIFSLGVILFNIRLSKFGFTEFVVDKKDIDLKNNLYQYIKDKKPNLYWELLGKYIDINDLSDEFKDLFFKMVSFNPKERPTIEEIYNHAWLKDIRNLNDKEWEQYEQEFINELKIRE